MDAFEFHTRAFPKVSPGRDAEHGLLQPLTCLSSPVLAVPQGNRPTPPGLPETGEYHFRTGGEAHINDPAGIASLQDAVREKNQRSYDAYSQNAHEQIKRVTLRGLLEFDFQSRTPIPIEQVEPWNEIVRRFASGAMSYGSISMEAHSTLAIAMNRLGGKSNTGEGGEDAERSNVLPNGDSMRCACRACPVCLGRGHH